MLISSDLKDFKPMPLDLYMVRHIGRCHIYERLTQDWITPRSSNSIMKFPDQLVREAMATIIWIERASIDPVYLVIKVEHWQEYDEHFRALLDGIGFANEADAVMWVNYVQPIIEERYGRWPTLQLKDVAALTQTSIVY